MSFLVSPGVYPNIIDMTGRPAAFPTSIGALVFASDRGSTDPRYITDRVRWINEYGNPNPTVGYGGYSGLAFLAQSPAAWGLRVTGTGAKRSLLVYVNDTYTSATGSPVAERTSVHAVTDGSLVDYKTINRQVVDLVFDRDLVSLNSIAATINGATVTGGATVFTTDNNTTLGVLAQKIQTDLNALGAGGQVFVVDRPTATASKRIIRVITPNNISVTLTATVTLGAGRPIVTQRSDWMFFQLAENPGIWGNNVASQIDTVDTGTAQRVRLSFSAGLVTSNVASVTIDGQVISTTFATDNNTTLEALAAAITANATAAVTATVISTGTANNRELLLVRKNALTDMTISAASVTAGASQATITYQEVLDRIVPSGTFTFRVYEGQNLRSPSEVYRLSLYDQVDGFGNQLNADYQLNTAGRSRLTRIYLNPVYSATNPVPASTTQVLLTNNTGYLAGGANGSTVTTAQIVQGWERFRDPEKITARILINAGYSTPEVHQKMVSICESRRDCFAVLDIPSASQDPALAKLYRQNEMNVNSKYAAAYAPDILVFDEFTGKRLYVPPSGYVAAQYAYTDRVTAEWFAPAGLIRGLISNALGLRYQYNEGDRDLLSTCQINAIRSMNGSFPIWGEYTLQVQASALQSVPVVRMLIRIETSLVDAANYFVFEPNNAFTRYRLVTVCTDFLEPIRKAQGLYEYVVICDEKNNPPTTIDQRALIVDVYLKPVLAALYIQVNSIVTKTSAVIDEIVQIRSNPN